MTNILKRLSVAAALGAAFIHAAEPRELTSSAGMKLVRIEPGEFRMGQDSPRADYSTIHHDVSP